MTTKKGIDVSAHQGTIDWKQVKKDGIDFAILRAGYGNDLSQEDSYFSQNYKGAKAQAIPVGAYWFSYATSVADAKQEAKVCKEVLSGCKLDYPVFYDFEYDSVRYAKEQGVTVTKSLATAFALAFCKELEAGGYQAGIYQNVDYYHNYFDQKKLAGYPVWLASWSQEMPDIDAMLWQYSDSGSVAGIGGPVDLNYDRETTSQTNGSAKTAVVTKEVSLREDGHSAAKILAKVPKGKTVTLRKDDGWGWSLVTYKTVTGWLPNTALKRDGLSRYKTGVCNGSDVNVREKPSLSGRVLRQIQKGQTFTVQSILPDRWLHVTLEGQSCYIYYDPAYIAFR